MSLMSFISMLGRPTAMIYLAAIFTLSVCCGYYIAAANADYKIYGGGYSPQAILRVGLFTIVIFVCAFLLLGTTQSGIGSVFVVNIPIPLGLLVLYIILDAVASGVFVGYSYKYPKNIRSTSNS